MSMDGLSVTDCERCSALCESRSRIVNGVGPADADLVFVGEAPGANEDAEGEPFVGRSGDVLDAALRKAGLARADVRITNCVRCRPPDNRDPHVAELDNCREFLATELQRLDPSLVVTLGKVPSEHLLGRSLSVTEAAGETFDARVDEVACRVLVSVHPAATLYDRSQQETFERAVARAADLAGLGDGNSGQSRLGEF
ncbi:uracil-DNA glycosylase family protein [Halosegnis sp.]|uniref:uracil-DNA glycosylase n=1 Tax=Halosegnis sp. TaxID=2864959 RepID=UPI0035D43EFE